MVSKNGVIIGLMGILAVADSVDAGKLSTRINSVPSEEILNVSTYSVVHHSLANEEQGIGDISFTEGPTPALDAYEVTSWSGDYGRLRQNASDADNMNSRTFEVHGRDLSGLVDAELTTTISEIAEENNMVGKEITRDVYDCRSDPCGVLVGSYDTKALSASGMTVSLEVENGHSYDVVDSFDSSTSWVRSDADRNGRVDLGDFVYLSRFFGRDCSTIVAPEDCYECHAIDTNDDGVIDMVDVTNFSVDWLEGEPLSMNFAPSFLKGEYAAGFDKTVRERVASYSGRDMS